MSLRDKELASVIKEISASMTRAEAERDLVREILKEKSKEFEMKPKELRKLAKLYFAQSLEKEIAEVDAIRELYEKVFGAVE
jgi:hypothetical protein